MDSELADFLNRLIRQADTTIPRLAKQANIPQPTLRNWCTGLTRNPRDWQPLIKVATALSLSRVDTNELLRKAHLRSIEQIEKSILSADDRKLIESWSKTRHDKNDLDKRIHQALANPEHSRLLDELCAQFDTQEVIIALSGIALDLTVSAWIRIRAFHKLMLIDTIDQETWDGLLADPDRHVLEAVIDALPELDVVLSREQLDKLISNPALPSRSTGLGRMVVEFTRKGADLTSNVLVPLGTHRSWEVRTDCIRCAIELDDDDSLCTLAAFARTHYWVARVIMADYIIKRIQEGRLSPKDRGFAEQIVSESLAHHPGQPGSRASARLHEALHMLGTQPDLDYLHTRRHIQQLMNEVERLISAVPISVSSEFHESVKHALSLLSCLDVNGPG